MKIKRFEIHGFRNLAGAEYSVDKHLILSGGNRTGKTNTLNAICWCLTGSDLFGNSNARDNIPFGCTRTGEVCSVLVEFDTFSVRRSIEVTDANDVHEILVVDNEPFETLKKSEALLNKKLGLLDFVLKQPKGFDIKKFLINPLYFTQVAPGTFRKFMCELADVDVAAINATASGEMKRLFADYNTDDAEVVADFIKKEIKNFKDILNAFKVIDPYLTDPSQFDSFKSTIGSRLKMREAELIVANNHIAKISDAMNTYYDSALGIKVILTEKGVGDGVVKNVCYLALPTSDDAPFECGSTAEKMLVGTFFIALFSGKHHIDPLPVLVDEYETLDSESADILHDICNSHNLQFIAAKVED